MYFSVSFLLCCVGANTATFTSKVAEFATLYGDVILLFSLKQDDIVLQYSKGCRGGWANRECLLTGPCFTGPRQRLWILLRCEDKQWQLCALGAVKIVQVC